MQKEDQMRAPNSQRKAFERIESALSFGYPVRAKDALSAFPREDIIKHTRDFAAQGRAIYTTWGNVDWLVPLEPIMSLDEFQLIQNHQLFETLEFAINNRIFTHRSILDFIQQRGITQTRSRKMAGRLWHLDLVELRSQDEKGEKYFCATARGRTLFTLAKQYSAPILSDDIPVRDLARFHKLIDL
jgi:hypothetical protein